MWNAGLKWQDKNGWYTPTASGAPVFPTLPGLVARWNALPANVTASGGNVVSVADLSGNSNPLTPVGGNVPYNNTTPGYNGHNAFNFVAANNACLASPTAPNTIPMGTGNVGYFYFVGQMLPGTTNFGGAVCYGVGGNNDFNSTGGGQAALTRFNTSNNLTWQGTVVNPPTGVEPAFATSTNFRVGLNIDTATIPGGTCYINNVLQVTEGIVGNFADAGCLVIGGRYLGAVAPASNPWEGPIVEIVVGNATLSSTDRSALDAYFVAQWGV